MKPLKFEHGVYFSDRTDMANGIGLTKVRIIAIKIGDREWHKIGYLKPVPDTLERANRCLEKGEKLWEWMNGK